MGISFIRSFALSCVWAVGLVGRSVWSVGWPIILSHTDTRARTRAHSILYVCLCTRLCTNVYINHWRLIKGVWNIEERKKIVPQNSVNMQQPSNSGSTTTTTTRAAAPAASMMKIFCKCVRAFNWARFCMSFFSEKRILLGSLEPGLFTLHSGCWGFFSFIYLFLYSLKFFTSCFFPLAFFSFVCLFGCLFVRCVSIIRKIYLSFVSHLT